MSTANRSRWAGRSCIAAALLWIVALVIEYRYGLFPPGSGPLFVLNQSMFALAMLGYVLGILGLFWAGAAGGWSGTLTLGLFGAGWCALLIGLVASLIGTSTVLEFLGLLGGIGGNLGAVLAGIVIAVQRRWRGWQRWAVLLYGLYYLLVLLLPIIVAEREPTLLTEALWAMCWLVIGAAVYTGDTARHAAHTALVSEGAHP